MDDTGDTLECPTCGARYNAAEASERLRHLCKQVEGALVPRGGAAIAPQGEGPVEVVATVESVAIAGGAGDDVAQTGPITRADVDEIARRVDEQLADLVNHGVAPKDAARRRKVARRAFRGAMLCKCGPCNLVYSSKGCCPSCGVPYSGESGGSTAALFKKKPAEWRRLCAELLADLLRVDGKEPRVCCEPAQEKWPRFDFDCDPLGSDDDGPFAEDDEPAEPASPSASKRGEKLGIRVV